MTAAVVQVVASTSGATTVASVSATVTGTIAGNTLGVFALIGSTASITSISGSVNGPYGIVDTMFDPSTTYHLVSAYKSNIAGGTDVVSATFNFVASAYGIIVAEIGGVIAMPLDGHIGQTQATPGTGTDGLTTGSGPLSTNANQPALILACAYLSASATLAAGTGFTSNGSFAGSSSVGGTFRLESKRITSTGAQAATWTAGNNNPAMSLLMVFDEGALSAQPLPAWPKQTFISDTIVQS
jgi:hypothetical protein